MTKQELKKLKLDELKKLAFKKKISHPSKIKKLDLVIIIYRWFEINKPTEIFESNAINLEGANGELYDESFRKIIHLMEDQGFKIDPKKPAIEVKNYTKQFKKFTANKNVTFKVGHGVIHGFIGPNGSGKTTTIKALIGAYKPTSGDLFINGYKVGTKKANSLIGYIPERASFPKHLNTIQYLTEMGEISGLKSKVAKERAYEILKLLKLEKHTKRKPSRFSSGMAKKVLLAQSLLTNPKVLILDEPAANLDPSARKELFQMLLTLRDEGRTIFISSHILSELERLIDEVTFLYYGEIVYTGDKPKLDSKNNVIYFSTENNFKAKKLLIANKFNVEGDVKTEMMIKNISIEDTKKIFNIINSSDNAIISYRANDLTTIYENLVSNSEKGNKGNQFK